MKLALKFWSSTLVSLVLLPIMIFSQPTPQLAGSAQNSAASFYPSGIWHKNMELKCNINFPYGASNEFLDMRDVNKTDGSNNITSTQKLLSTCMWIDERQSPKFSTPYENAQRVVFYDVTNINSGLPIVCEIRIKTGPGNATFHFLEFASMYQNPIDNHTYCVIGSTGNQKTNNFLVYDDQSTENNDIYARAIIIDLTEAMNLGGTSEKREIIIDDPTNRNSAHLNGSTSMTNKVYIGYIKYEPEIYRLHTMTFDNPSGILAISPVGYSPESADLPTTTQQRKGYFELVYFGDIHKNTNYNSTTDFVVPTVLSESGIDGGPIEVKIPTFNDPLIGNTNQESFAVHETHVHRAVSYNTNGDAVYDDNTIYVNLACFGGSFPIEAGGNRKKTDGVFSKDYAEGGVVVMKLNLTRDQTNPEIVTSASVDPFQWFKYESDRQSPEIKLPSNALELVKSNTHTAESIHIDKYNHFFVTTDERASGASAKNSTDNGSTYSFNSTDNQNSSGIYNYDIHYNIGEFNSTDKSTLENKVADERKTGNYVRVWGADELHARLIGIDDEHHSSNFDIDPNDPTKGPYYATGGPIGSYDIPEKTVADNLSLSNNSRLQPSTVTYTENSANSNENAYGLNTSHHIRTLLGTSNKVPNDTKAPLLNSSNEEIGFTEESYKLRREAFLANYSQGVRVVDFKNFLKLDHEHSEEAKELIERAYFDFVPTLNSNIDSRYFYRMRGGGIPDDKSGVDEEYNFYKTVLPFGLPNYYMGAFDAIPDRNVNASDTRYNSDENYVYAYSLNGKQAPWCQYGGILALRYFRDELGGTITGNYPSILAYGNNPDYGANMAFGEVNLQGDFKLMRDLTVANSATVTLMPGRSNDNHHSPVMAINPKTSTSTDRIYVDGTLNIGIQEIKDYAGNVVQNEGDDDGTRIDINVPITVRAGGKLILHPIRSDKSKPINLSMVTIETGGNLEIKPGTYVNINGESGSLAGLICYGSAKIEGGTTVDKRIVICGKSQDKSIETRDYAHISQAILFFFKSGSNTLNLKNTDFQRAYVNCSQSLFTGANPIDNCKFEDNSTNNIVNVLHNYPLLEIGSTSDGINLGLNGFATISNCTFSDVSTSLPSNVYYRTGLAITRLSQAEITNCSFNKLKVGINSYVNGHTYLKNSTFNDGIIGLTDVASENLICTNSFTKFRNPIVLNSYRTKLNGNFFNYSEKSVSLEWTEEAHFKGNTFHSFINGLFNYNSTAYLVGAQMNIGNNPIAIRKEGRNKFNCDFADKSNNPYLSNLSNLLNIQPNFSDIYFKYDKSKAYLTCGYNDFSFDDTHLYYEKAPSSSINLLSVGCDYNNWNPKTGSSCVVRYQNINVLAPNNQLCVSQSPITSCGFSGVDIACDSYLVPIIQFPLNVTGLNFRTEEIIDETPGSNSIDSLFYIVKNHLDFHNYNGTDSLNVIQNALLNGAFVGDSINIKLNLVKPYLLTSMSDTSNNQHNKLAVMYRLQKVYEWQRKCDSLHIINNLILINAETNRDTMMVIWSNKRTKIPMTNLSNLNYADSMRTIYLNRVIDDIAIKYDSLGYAYKKSLDEETDNSTIGTESVLVSPNPFDQQITININLITRSKVEIKLITLDGKEVTNLFNETLNAGTRVINKDIVGISSGAYYLIVKINDFQYLNKVVKE